MEKLLSVTEYCKKHQKDSGNIRRLLLSKRIKGYKIGNQWVINENEKYPEDNRIKTGIYKNAKQKAVLFANKELMSIIKKMNKELTSQNKTIVKTIIYGSYARNEQTNESDVDIALLTKNDIDKESLVDVVSRYEIESGKVLSVIDIDEAKYTKYKNSLPFYTNIDKEGIVIWNRK